MLKKLNPSLEERLRDRFRDHPLLMTCQKVFHHYMASMDWNDFTSERLFMEIAEVLDTIFLDPASAKQYVSTLWDSLKIKFKANTLSSPAQKDLDTVCGILFYTTASVLSLHWRTFYKEELVGLLVETVRRNGLYFDVDEERIIISNLSTYSEGVEDWIANYDGNVERLSYEIDSAIHGKNQSPPKSKPKQTKRRKNQFTKATFIYAGVENDQYLKQRMNLIIDGLIGSFVKSYTNRTILKDLFTGKEIDKKDRLTWIGTTAELTYFFRQLNKKGWIKWNDNEHLWSIVASHFEVVTQLKNGKTKKVSITAQSLENNSQSPKSATKKLLDDIIVYFTPNLHEIVRLHVIDTETEAENARFQDMAANDYNSQLTRERDKYKDKR